MPEPADTVVRKVFHEPALNSARANGSWLTEAVLILMLAPNAPEPLAVVPSPLWTCTEEMRLWSDGMLTQNTSCDSESLRVMPLRVTLICEPLLPRIVIAELPSPVPPSL